MEGTEKLDLLITKMADPALMKKLCLTYNKKRSIKYKDNANIPRSGDNNKRSFFNETEECLKLLGSLGQENVANLSHKQMLFHKNFKEFDSEDKIKNCIDETKKSCRITEYINKQDKNKKKSREQRRNKKSNANSVITLSIDSSHDGIELINKCTIDECEVIPSKITNKKKSCEKNKLFQVSNVSVALINNKSKSKIMVQNKHHSPKSKLSNRKGKEYSAISNTEETCTNKKSAETKIKPSYAVFRDQHIITTSSDSSTDSDEDIFKKKKLKTNSKKSNEKKSAETEIKPSSAVFREQHIITISSDSSIDSDEDIFKKKELNTNSKKSNKKKSAETEIKPSSVVFREQHIIAISSDSSTDSDEDIFKKKKLNTSSKKSNEKKSAKTEIKPSSAVFREQHIITISSDSLTDSDEDIFKKKILITNRKKFKVKKGEGKHFKACANFASVNKPANISEADTGNEVSLLDPYSISKSDPSRTVKGHSSGNIPFVKNKLISEQNNEVKVIKELEESTVINGNRAQNTRKRETHLKKTGKKLPAKSGKKSNCSFISNPDNLSNFLCNSNVVLHNSDTYDENVLFIGAHKSVNSSACIDEYKTSFIKASSQKGTPFIKQTDDLENPEKAHNSYSATCVDKNVSSNLLCGSTESWITNGKFQSNSSSIDLDEFFVSTNFGKKTVNEGVFSKQSKTHELIKGKIDFEPEPVDFEIPPLHEKERVDNPSKEDLVKWKKLGVKRKNGPWTPKEEEILGKNFAELSKKYGISDPCVIFGINSDHKRDTSILKFLRAKHFYVRLGKDLNNRTLKCIYKKARRMFHPHASNKKWTAEDISKLMYLYRIFGPNWNKIGQALKKTGQHCAVYFSFIKGSKYKSMLQNKKYL